jgi:uncharacterized protein
MEFEWDDEKAELNSKKHGIKFTDAVMAFDDDLAIPYADPEHSSIGESRYALLGMCPAGLVFVSFTIRDDKYRIISARKASRKMQRTYAETD